MRMRVGEIWKNPEDGTRYELKSEEYGLPACSQCILKTQTACRRAPCRDVGRGYFVVPQASIGTKPKRTTDPLVQETSREALKSQRNKAGGDCRKILSLLKRYRGGRTCDALETMLLMSHQTTSARLRDLALRGDIRDSGKRQKTRTGRSAIVWKIVAP